MTHQIECDYCNEEAVDTVNDHPLCDECLTDRTYGCGDCGMTVLENEDCECQDLDLHSYTYRPRPKFHGTDSRNLFFGMEIEVELPNRRASLNDAIKITKKTLGAKVYLKRDGSLENGFEIVTHPISAEMFKQTLGTDKLAKLANAGLRSWDTTTAGVHIHLSECAFTQTHKYKFLEFVQNNEDAISTIAGRRNSRWAQFSGNKTEHLRYAKGAKNSSRYVAVNLQNEKTIELRMFKGSLNTVRINTYVDLANAMFDYTKSISIKDTREGKLEWSEFAKFVKQNSAKYPDLAEHSTVK